MLLETDTCEGTLVSRDKLKELVEKTKCDLEFVVVLTCHSQDQGEIFLQAGARHVVCIDRDFEVLDAAAVTFTDTFYKLIFQENMDICNAFDLAKSNVGIRFTKEEYGVDEERKFLLLVNDPENHDNCINYRYSVGLKNVPTDFQFSKHNCRALCGSRPKEGKCIDTHENKTMLN